MPSIPENLSNPATSRVRLIIIASLFCLSVALLAFVYLGLFNRYLIDDYCVAVALRDKGFIGTQKFWYQNWSGRYTCNLLSAFVSLFGHQTTKILPTLSIIVWLFAIVWSIKQFNPKTFLTSSTISPFLAALLLIYSTLQATPSLLQSFYWQAGMLTYLAPLILLTFYVGFIRNRTRHPQTISWLLISAGFTFLTGGLSETALALQTGAILIMIIVCLKSPEDSLRRAALPLLIAGLMGSVLSGFVQILSSGNAIRQSVYPAHPSWFSIVKLSLTETLNFLFASIRTKAPLSLSVSLLLPFAIGFLSTQEYQQPTNSKRQILCLAVLPLTAFILVWFCIIPSIYAMPYPPLPRVMIMPQYVLTIFCIMEGYISGLMFGRTIPFNKNAKPIISIFIVASVLILGPLTAVKRIYKLADKIKSHSARWDETDIKIKNAKLEGKEEVEIQNLAWFAESINSFEDFDKAETDINYQLNRCVEKYYQLKITKIK